MPYKCLQYEAGGGVGLVTLNRPDSLNAINRLLVEELGAVLDEVERDSGVGAVIITGAGRMFCAGADLSDILNSSGTMEVYGFLKKAQGTINRLWELPKAVVAAVNGPALGGGFELCLACDFCVASDRAVFGLPEINVGVLPGGGGMTRLPRLVGIHLAKQLVLTGQTVDAVRAHGLGLVYRIVPPDELLSAARELAVELAAKPPLGLQAAKRVINRSGSMELSSAMDYEARSVAMLFDTADCREGVKAFLEKRRPQYRGR
ncbi:MAG: enoyl-CoA hydratase/isomerase family protein [Bacillota bacterium]